MAEEKNTTGVCGLVLTDIKIFPFKEGVNLGHLRGLAQIIFNNAIVVRGIRIMENNEGEFFVSYPLDPFYKGENFKSIVEPTDRTLYEYVQEQVLAKYKALVG